MKHLFIINPAAGKGRGTELIKIIHEVMADIKGSYIIEVTERPGQATEIAKAYSEKGQYRIYAVGGDGTLNEVLNGMARTNCSLSVIPVGTGNDFIKSFIFSKKILKTLQRRRYPNRLMYVNSLKKYILDTILGTEVKIDLMKVNNQFCLNIASVGFDAEVVAHTEKLKKRKFVPGRLAYILGMLTTLAFYRPRRLDIHIGRNHVSESILLAAVANGRYYGGGMQPAPRAQIDDGLLDLCLVKDMSRLKMLILFPKYMRGTHEKIKEVDFFRRQSFSISSKELFPINIDGEVVYSKRAHFTLIGSGVNFIIPQYEMGNVYKHEILA